MAWIPYRFKLHLWIRNSIKPVLTDFGTDELNDYLESMRERRTVSPREWWHVNGDKFPVLEAMAWDLLSIPAMLAEVERVFSR